VLFSRLFDRATKPYKRASTLHVLRCGTHSGALAAALLLDVCRTCVHFVGVGGSGVEVSEAANEQQRRVAAHCPTISASQRVSARGG